MTMMMMMTPPAGPGRRPLAVDRVGRKRSRVALCIILKNGHFRVEFQYDAGQPVPHIEKWTKLDYFSIWR